jgi:hypothetical protein
MSNLLRSLKHQCCQCNQMAVWKYIPLSEMAESNRYYCEACIKRGCSCNFNFISGEEDVDELGRSLPCVEYDFNKEGFNAE